MIEFFCKIIPPSSIDLDSQGMQEHSGCGCSGAWSLGDDFTKMFNPITSLGSVVTNILRAILANYTNIGVSTARGRKCGHNAH